jgi:V/A-type H+/Na+-transporting ATPase subunit I
MAGAGGGVLAVLVPMAKVRIIGSKRRLGNVLEELHRLELVHLADVQSEEFEVEPLAEENGRPSERADELRVLIAELEALLVLLGRDHEYRVDRIPGSVDAAEIRAQLEEVSPRVQELRRRLDSLGDEQIVLPRYLRPLEHLLPLVPELARVEERDPDLLRLDMVALVLNTTDESIVEALRQELGGRLGDRFELVHETIEDGAIGCVLIFEHGDAGTIRELLGEEHIRHTSLPEKYENLSLYGTVSAMKERLDEIPAEISETRAELRGLLEPYAQEWRTLLAKLRAELEQMEAAALAGGTGRAFVVACWVPKPQLEHLREELEERVGPEVVVEEVPTDPRDEKMPVLLRNPAVARPYESLVRLLDLPKPGTLDPTGLMALFLPFMFGVMVGDVVYGLILFAIALWMRRHFTEPGVLRDLSSVLVVGSVWSVIFGFIYGEALGNLGRRLLGYDWALWVYRPEALTPILIFALAVGATHVVLGLLLGIWQGWQARHRGEVLEKVGTLAVIAGLFGLAGLVTDLLPANVITPAVAVAILGLVLVMGAHGGMGLLTGPLELIGALGNLLSYLRLAAVGLASAYLAIVANEFAYVAPLWIGVVVAVFFHALNVALAGFSPMIQSMRLHYVEFFNKFYAGGGRPFAPFGARLADSPEPVRSATRGKE